MMPSQNREFVAVQWSSETEDRFAAPGEKTRLLQHGIGGRVCRVIGMEGPYAVIQCGTETFRVSPEKLIDLSGVKHEIGETVPYKGGTAKIVDAIWHYEKGEPFYLLEIDGKKKSRRYFSEDLDPTC